MPNNNLTDAEIIKALECCGKEILCIHCPLQEPQIKEDLTCFDNLKLLALDLINRLQEKDKTRHKVFETKCEELEIAKAEIERLKASLNIELENFATEYDNKIKAEAYKEFAERVKIETGYLFSADSIEVEVDNLLKELVGEDNASKH